MLGTGRTATTCLAGKAAGGGEFKREILYPQQHDPGEGSSGAESQGRMAAMAAPCNWSTPSAATMLLAAASRASLRPLTPRTPQAPSGSRDIQRRRGISLLYYSHFKGGGGGC